ncbi:MAG TPA: ferredoxin reductase [Solirubrobacteraceae bacterium]|nr:ferredoxin reductase [Solirubrobacteraceae bacterium]
MGGLSGEPTLLAEQAAGEPSSASASASAPLVHVPSRWHSAGVREVRDETAHAKTIVLDDPAWPGHFAGQHVDVRLTAEDGYQAQRSYSIASAPEEPLALTVERIDDGEVSPYLTEELRAGDELELRGPVGGHFTWRTADGGPLLLLAGGSGLVPLMAMTRHRIARADATRIELLVSSRSLDDLLFAEELKRAGAQPGIDVKITLTRAQPPGWSGLARRVDRAMLAELGPPPSERPRVFLCGPTAFVESAADALVALGHAPSAIHAERFGPSGG